MRTIDKAALAILEDIVAEIRAGAIVTLCSVADAEEGGQTLSLRWGDEEPAAPAAAALELGCPACGSHKREVFDDGALCADCGAQLPPG